MNNRCQWCGARLPWSPDSDDVANVCHGAYACSARQAWEEGADAERAAVVAWLRGKAHDPTWLRAHGVQSRQGVCTLEEAADDIERGKHEVDEPDQCMDCGAIIIGAHGCQGVPGDEES